MPTVTRKRTQVSFTKAARTPSARPKAKKAVEVFDHVELDLDKAWGITPRKPKGLSPLAQYITDNEGGDCSILELVEQFQEYECDHQFREIANTAITQTLSCFVCALSKTRFKPGAKPEDG